MLTIRRTGLLLLAVAGMFGTGCRKYAEGPSRIGGQAAYLRVFNLVPSTVNPLNSAVPAPFFTFLMDPTMDAAGVPNGGSIVCDWLGQRQAYVSSVSLNEGNSLGASLDTFVTHNINYEYPGSAHVLTAPPLNGYDLTAWAQVPSGKHRVMFVSRPQTDTAFAQLSGTIREGVLIDTTIDLQPGEVYTLEAVSTDEDNDLFGVYLRPEQFIHQAFSDSNIYVGFYNVSGVPSAYNTGVYAGNSPYVADFEDTLQIRCTYNLTDYITSNASAQAGNSQISYYALPGYNNQYLATLYGRMMPTTQFIPLPLLPSAYYYNGQGILGTYAPLGVTVGGAAQGTLPWVSFSLTEPNASTTAYGHQIDCDQDPAQVDNAEFTGFEAGIQVTGFNAASLSWLVNLNGNITARPSVVTFEIAYGAVYMMRIQPAAY